MVIPAAYHLFKQSGSVRVSPVISHMSGVTGPTRHFLIKGDTNNHDNKLQNLILAQ